jgi:hypothetical protein
MIRASVLAPVLAGGLIGFSLPAAGDTLHEDFASNPAGHGWKVFGNTDLFAWDSTAQNLQVTWDSSQPNSYYFHSLGTVLTKADDFSLGFDLRLSSSAAGINTAKPNPFQLAVGLINLGQATQPGFLRGTGSDSPDLVEFSFFPDPGGAWIWGPSLTTTMIDESGTNWSTGGFGPYSLSVTDLYQITLTYTASNQTLHTSILKNGASFGPVSDAQLNTNFLNLYVDQVAVCSYSDAGQDPAYAGSILAQGTIDNFVVTMPPPPVGRLQGGLTQGIWQVTFLSATNWLYTLERTSDFQSWVNVGPAVSGTGAILTLQDTNPPSLRGLYRVQAQPQ